MRKLLLIAVALCSLGVTTAHAEYFTIKGYHVDVTFGPDGDATFVEEITVEFSQPRHGIYRYIPYRSNVNGQRVDRIIQDIEVDGFKFNTSKENLNIVVRIGDADTYVDGRQVYRITYHVLNPLNFFDEHTEFYWDLLGISWPVSTESFTFRIQFPDRVTLTDGDVRCFSGTEGSETMDISYQVAPKAIAGNATRVLQQKEGVTVAVRLAKDAFVPMSTWQSFYERHGLLLAPILFLFSGLLAFFMARNKRQVIMTEYFPPEGISPVVAGGFVDHSVDNNDILSLIPHLANKGYLRMEAGDSTGKKKSDLTFIKLKEPEADLQPFESEFLHSLFITGDQVQLRNLKDQFYVHLASVRKSVQNWIRDQGWYEPDQRTMGCVTAVGGVGAIVWGAIAVFAKQNYDGIALIVTGFILFFLASRFNKRSPAGNATFRKLEGFRNFVSKAERPVIERLLKEDPLYYDKTMPFALAFGYLKKWNKQFEGLLTQPPSWYGSPHMYGSDLSRSWDTFSTSFPTEVNEIGSVFSSAPSSSGSGGGGGGGFSGGGSGGGGGGSW
jgi:uncharacterized membrane protein